MRRSPLFRIDFATFSVLALWGCPDAVQIDLGGPGVGPDGGRTDSGVECSAASTCPPGQYCEDGVCVLGCVDDRSCPAGSSCLQGSCIESCGGGGAPTCEHCGSSYSASCDGQRFLCDDGLECLRQSCVDTRSCGSSCNSDDACEPGEYCESNFQQRIGRCTPCNARPATNCPGGRPVSYSFGNGCVREECECPAGTSLSPGGGCEGPGPAGWLELDPGSLIFFGLPINSQRMAVSGYDPDARTCVTIVFDYSNNGLPLAALCSPFVAGVPYTFITPNTDGPCGGWDYQGNVATQLANGCVDFEAFGTPGFEPGLPAIDLADLTLSVSGAPYSGYIRVNNRTRIQPRPVSFVFTRTTDIPDEPLYIQQRDLNGEIGWIHILADGVPFSLVDSCQDTHCGQSPRTCGFNAANAPNITLPGAFSAQASATWDGLLNKMPTGAACVVREAAHPRRLSARACYAYRRLETGQGSLVDQPTCKEVEFEYPVDVVRIEVSEGG